MCNQTSVGVTYSANWVIDSWVDIGRILIAFIWYKVDIIEVIYNLFIP